MLRYMVGGRSGNLALSLSSVHTGSRWSSGTRMRLRILSPTVYSLETVTLAPAPTPTAVLHSLEYPASSLQQALMASIILRPLAGEQATVDGLSGGSAC